MDFVVAIKESVHGPLVIVTDKGILGEKFAEENLHLDISQRFYQGEQKKREEVVLLCRGARHLHFTGEASVQLGIAEGFIDKDKILYIQRVPHAQSFLE